MNSMKKRVLSGMRSSGRLHLGNYLGGLKGMLELQKNPDYETFYMVADLHAMTTPYEVEALRKGRKEVVLDYLAAGLDPEKSVIFEQSDSYHTELAFYLSSVVTIARMQHLPTYKDKVKQYPEHNTMALLNYPVLMAADILIYKAGLVPVGIDQEPHLEVAREIARKMNGVYGTDFPEPKRFATIGEYIPSLTGEGKMSKSVEGSSISLDDSRDQIIKKIRSIPTSTEAGGEMTSGVKALFALAKIFLSESEVNFFKTNYDNGKKIFLQLKDGISDAIIKEFMPIQEKRKELEAKPEYVEKVLKDGAEKARKVAEETLREVKLKMGLS